MEEREAEAQEAAKSSKAVWRRNTGEERKAQRSRWRKRQREKQELEENNFLEDLQKEKKLKKEAECKAYEQEQRSVKLEEMYVELKKNTERESGAGHVKTRFSLDFQAEAPKIRRSDLSAPNEDGGSTKIGSGTFSHCYMMRYRGVLVAVKSLKLSTVSKKDVEKEAALIMALAHPGLPHLFGVCTDKKPYLIVTQFHGILKGKQYIPSTLKQLSQSEKSEQRISADDMTRVLCMVCDAVEYLHQRTILHNDLKGDNIVLERRYCGQLSPVVVDFGKACLFGNARTLYIDKFQQEEYMRKYKHIAPEVVKGQRKQSESSDIFSFGVLLRYCCHLQGLAQMCMTRWETRPSLSFVRHELSNGSK